MAGRGPSSFNKRQKEQKRKEKQQEKFAKRLEKKLNPPAATDDQLEGTEPQPDNLNEPELHNKESF
jgi:hypothetical protein